MKRILATIFVCVTMLLLAACNDPEMLSEAPAVSSDSGDEDFEYEMVSRLLTNWDRMGRDETKDERICFDEKAAYIFDEVLEWSVTAADAETIMVDIGGIYSAKAELRGEMAVLTLREVASGAEGFYYDSDFGYDRTWPEYIYALATVYLNDCLEEEELGYIPDFWDYTEIELVRYSGNSAWRRVYELFDKLGDYKDSEEIIAGFTVLEDMYIGATVYNASQKELSYSDYSESYTYNEQGQLISGRSDDLSRMYGCQGSRLYFFYDENGILTEIRVGSDYGISDDEKITPAYDSLGRIIGGVYRSDGETWDLSYTYDDRGRLIENTVWDRGERYQFTYTYDLAGNLIKCVCLDGWKPPEYYTVWRSTTDYSYDAAGYLTEKVTVAEGYIDFEDEFYFESRVEISYTNRDDGNPLEAECFREYGWTSYAETIRYIYEDLYFFE